MAAPPLVLPGLYLPDAGHVDEHVHGSARLWADVVRPGAVTVLVPDLSRDVVLGPDGPLLTARTTALTRVRHDARTATAGVRLPITATDVRVDTAWEGWRARRAPEDRLDDALAHGAITWTEDPLLAACLHGLGSRSAGVAEVAGAVFLSERTLRRRTHRALGVGPVHVRRVLRLHRLVDELRRHPVATAVQEAGYADQSHAARDVRSLAGMTLRQLALLRMAE
ncbi:helix-turn-helix transcriptional regulator [Cellulosimicrobium cellulans]|uniref:helix-turn-helix transcriptional regulator n=1 Tax=Cellulosimicrobium cellulans TaxID=1710 RepID=UPI000848EFB8|nr:helix-turn-helix domain-containing protein [Cellulosimicrobium cellulans]